ncbi:MAG: dihydropteroate synthase [Elusimicrobia bacterium]|nr:dihydropteroate synthase [Elusimicrobiota bacterium]
MGVVNVTPDSFYEGGRCPQPSQAIERALQLVEEGADILDIGGESSRPGAEPIGPAQELERVLEVIEALASKTKIPISIDTVKASVASQALRAGASWINDISALRYDPQMLSVCQKHPCPILLMHMQGTPKTMQQKPAYAQVVPEIIRFFRERLQVLSRGGISPERILLDPGIGFGKTLDHNLQILKNLDEFRRLGRPLAVGASRKSFIAQGWKRTHPDAEELAPPQRLEGSLAAAIWCAWKGVEILRVHDVLATRRALAVISEIQDV